MTMTLKEKQAMPFSQRTMHSLIMRNETLRTDIQAEIARKCNVLADNLARYKIKATSSVTHPNALPNLTPNLVCVATEVEVLQGKLKENRSECRRLKSAYNNMFAEEFVGLDEDVDNFIGTTI